MGKWCKDQHNKSGLVTRCKQSSYFMAQAEHLVLSFIKEHVDKNVGILAGNSVHVDKTFLHKDMPKLHDYVNYRIMDVTSLREICKRWYPDALQNVPKKKKSHRAMEDIKESITELRYYRHTIFKS